jgi:hypothetical protein
MTYSSPKYVATIVGRAGQRAAAEFDKLTDAMRLCAKLQSGERSEILFRGEVVWSKSFPDGADKLAASRQP